MAEKVKFTIDGREIEAEAGRTIMEAADSAGVYIPRLCYMPGLTPHGSCRVCTVVVDGRFQTACTQPVSAGATVENASPKLLEYRQSLIDMLFVEGNHYCMFCEKSGNCELQALAYRFAILAPRYPYIFPRKEMDSSHPDVFVDRNRCVLCARCILASKQIDGKNVFQFLGRAFEKKIAVNSETGLGGTNLELNDRAVDVCPVGTIMRKRVGYRIPIGRRKYDHRPIGWEIEHKQEPGRGTVSAPEKG